MFFLVNMNSLVKLVVLLENYYLVGNYIISQNNYPIALLLYSRYSINMNMNNYYVLLANQ